MFYNCMQKWICISYSTNKIFVPPKSIYSFFRRRFPIKDTPQNLVDLGLHYVYGMSLALMTFIVDQLKHILLELFYPWIGPELAFHIWTFVFLLENIGV